MELPCPTTGNYIANSTSRIGDISELKCCLRFIELGYKVSIPYGQDQRYDLLVDTGDRILRVQVKTGRTYKDYIRWKCCSGDIHTYTKEQIDYYAIYYPVKDQCYLVDVAEGGIKMGTLRLTPPKIKTSNTTLAEDYIL